MLAYCILYIVIPMAEPSEVDTKTLMVLSTSPLRVTHTCTIDPPASLSSITVYVVCEKPMTKAVKEDFKKNSDKSLL